MLSRAPHILGANLISSNLIYHIILDAILGAITHLLALSVPTTGTLHN